MLLMLAFGLVTFAVAIYAVFEARILLGFWHKARHGRAGQILPKPKKKRTNKPAPDVTVQLPIYNEGAVALDLIRAVSRLDYPRDRLHIQVLDDSTDGTSALIAPEVNRLAKLGLDIAHMCRDDREGWKAGALAAGLAVSDSEFVAMFDADFLPPPNYLRSVLVEGSAFDDPQVAFIQGRWTYSNERQNLLTRAQAILLDRHFVIQKPFQMAGERTILFNGSAGIWRRAAIDSVGGWSADTLCEDMDLSYRCALKGWIGTYEESLVCPSEIPASLFAFKLQQRRWAKGSAQCVRKLAVDIIRSKQLRHRWDDLYAALGYVLHPLLLSYTLLWPWVVLDEGVWAVTFAGQMSLTAANLIGILGFALTSLISRRGAGFRSLRDIGFALMLGASLMINNTFAFIVGCFERASVFERTPKQGKARRPSRAGFTVAKWCVTFELAFSTYLLGLAWYMIGKGFYAEAVPCVALGFGMAGAVLYQYFELPAASERAPLRRSIPARVRLALRRNTAE
ncbi:glycosyltransferase family 2 protein [Aquabacter spiritensis]|uniref:Cellulose synthase/poly-beta-1,6-N-acetylglucosamine synthase-like glycosyltransferase n=1 Tax=Aquabacter spiritensis TaxID=933073 RepID=A0A4R3LWA6_9HYPH|nr:glycosyltransferase family 2 protein [Aquabacter spiritensis]TCT04019.1 cellulose synthase/poly-beta-1,6-N-acetylglucosamine synthase-like glycosyltransferase [Aquabacter spiritensis]